MPESQQIFQMYDNVPDGATLEIWVEGNAGEFASNAVIDETNSDDDGFLTHSQLYRAGGANTAGTWTLHSPHSYIVKIRTKFNLEDEKEATVNARVVEKNGQQYRDAWSWKAKGKSSEIHHLAGLFINTASVAPATPQPNAETA